MKISTALMTVCAVALGGCAAPIQPQSAPYVVTTETPFCGSTRQCEAMWDAAQTAMGRVTGMRNKISTDNRIETFAPTTITKLGGVARKVPRGEKGYEISVTIECYGHFNADAECDNIRAMSTDQFNILVLSAGLGVR
jgi:hypothetical protein